MTFNFRQALENLQKTREYYETPEGKAEWFLKKAIDEMIVKNISFEKIGEIYLGLILNYDDTSLKLFISYVPKDEVQEQKFWTHNNEEIPEKIKDTYIFSMNLEKYNLVENYKEGHLIFEAIEKELETQGFIYEDIAPLHRKRDGFIVRYSKITF